MGKKIASAVLFVNLLKKNSSVHAQEIQGELEKRGIVTTVFSFKGEHEKLSGGQWDIAFSIGGDGTVLYAARCLAPLGVPILPVNLGSVGFIAGVDSKKWLEVFLGWEKGDILLSRRCMLELCVERNSQIIMKNHCLNDVVVSSTGIAKLVNLEIHLSFADGEKTAPGEIGEMFVDAPSAAYSYRCDGLIIATPTGSTAYSLAAGGPILDPEMEAVIINPICPFTLSNRPFVLPSRQALSITVAEEQRSGVLLTVDGQDIFPLECKDRILIRQAPWPALLIFADRYVYFSGLQTKLFRNGRDHA